MDHTKTFFASAIIRWSQFVDKANKLTNPVCGCQLVRPWCRSTLIDVRLRLNIAIADDAKQGLRVPDYTEGVIGSVYRPVFYDRLNLLAIYNFASPRSKHRRANRLDTCSGQVRKS